MSEREVEFLRDIQGIIDYTIRNDLGLANVVATVGHDVNRLFPSQGLGLRGQPVRFRGRPGGLERMTRCRTASWLRNLSPR
jgi:hypothetical protein